MTGLAIEDGGPVLPAWVAPPDWADAHAGAGRHNGRRRSISWCIGDLQGPILMAHRCRYNRAHIEVNEGNPGASGWAGEATRVHATRTVVTPSVDERGPFTDKARTAIEHEVLGPINRYGFDRLWQQVYRGTHRADADAAVLGAARLRERATWWDECSEVRTMVENSVGAIEHIRSADLDGYGRHPTCRPPAPYRGAEEIAAYVVVDGERVGVMVMSGDVFPLRQYPS